MDNFELPELGNFKLPEKVLFMGLAASGKSSIRTVAFEGRLPEEVRNYKATISYVRSTKRIIDSSFQLFDCGGQESFISLFIGEQAEFIFSKVAIFVWVVDMNNYEQLSTSKFYFDHAITRLHEFSPDASVFCLLHKRDLINPEMRDQAFDTVKQHFQTDLSFNIEYRTTSIFDQSIYQIVGEMVQTLINRTTKAKTVSEAILDFLDQNDELSGIAIYTEDGVPVFEEGELASRLFLPINLSLTNYKRIKEEYRTLKSFRTTLELNENLLVFQRLKNELLFAGIAKKSNNFQYTLVKMDKITEIVNELI